MSAEGAAAAAPEAGLATWLAARRAGWHEARLWLAVSPLAFLGLRLAGRRRVQRLLRFGTLVNDPELGRQILTDAVRFRTVGTGTHGELMDLAIGQNALLNMDGSEHETLRRALGPLFTPDASARLVEGTIGKPLERARAILDAGGSLDLAALVRVITGRTAFALLGAPEPDDGDAGYLASYRRGERLVGMTVQAIRRGTRPDELARARELVDELAEPGRAGWAAGGGTIGRLRDLGFDFESARAIIVTIILAGTETVTAAGPRIVALLLDHRRWRALAGGDPAAVDAAIEAGLRLVTPTEVIVRSCAEDATIGGRTFRRGERLFLSVYGMTRWGRLYDGDPEALRLGRPMPREIRHLWFGAGPHFCLGAPIARLQLRALLTLLARYPSLAIVERAPARGVLFPAYGRLVVRP